MSVKTYKLTDADIKRIIVQALDVQNLDNDTIGITAISSGKDNNDMAQKRIRREVDIDGQKFWITAHTEQEYVDKYKELLFAHSIQFVPVQNKSRYVPTFKEYTEKFMALYKRKGQIRHTTLAGYESSLANHLYPYFGSLHIDSISIDIIQDFFNHKRNLAKKTMKEIHLALKFVLDAAMEDGYIRMNPAKSKRLRLFGKESVKREPLTAEQLADVTNHIPELEQLRDRRFLALLCYMPVRREDVLGIQMKDIDAKHMILHIRQSVTFALHPFTDTDTGKSYKAGQPVIGAPKTEAGTRIIPIVPQLWHLLEVSEEELADGEKFLLPSKDRPYLPYTAQTMKRAWERMNKTVNLYGKTAHCFRHTFATIGQRSISTKTMQVIGGWSDAQTLNKVYTHTQAEDIELAREQMAKMYAN